MALRNRGDVDAAFVADSAQKTKKRKERSLLFLVAEALDNSGGSSARTRGSEAQSTVAD